jgi:molybdopterin molybdotransferase
MMIPVEEALEKVLSAITPLSHDTVPLLNSHGLITAETINSSINIPPLDNSGMDGYAVRSEDIKTSSYKKPTTLRIIEETAAGTIPKKRVLPMTATRIMTGAPIPNGADTVVRFEDTNDSERSRQNSNSNINIYVPAKTGTAIRQAGGDIKIGENAITAGTEIGPAQIGVLASLGNTKIKIFRRPKVSIISSGNELVSPGHSLPEGHIYDINTYSIASSVARLGGTPEILGIAKDTRESLIGLLEKAKDSDLIITSAGVSAGYYDLVKEVIQDYGSVDLWSVKMRPGKPVVFGELQGPKNSKWPSKVPILGLPGNPVSAMVVFHIFGRPILKKMMGHKKWDPVSIEATLLDPIDNEDGRRVYARALIDQATNGEYTAKLSGPQGSNVLTAMARANGLAICPEDINRLEPGSKVRVELL